MALGEEMAAGAFRANHIRRQRLRCHFNAAQQLFDVAKDTVTQPRRCSLRPLAPPQARSRYVPVGHNGAILQQVITQAEAHPLNEAEARIRQLLKFRPE
jgi:hypothetical protein